MFDLTVFPVGSPEQVTSVGLVFSLYFSSVNIHSGYTMHLHYLFVKYYFYNCCGYILWTQNSNINSIYNMLRGNSLVIQGEDPLQITTLSIFWMLYLSTRYISTDEEYAINNVE